jgi:mitogen-activated protein kinase kinase kinase
MSESAIANRKSPGGSSPLAPLSVALPQNDSRELKQWLTKCNCQQYYNRFVDQGITYDLLSELDTSALKELGISKLGDRLRLEIAISQLKANQLKNMVSIEDIYSQLNLMNLNATSPGSNSNSTVNPADYALTSNNDATIVQPADIVNQNVQRSSFNLGSSGQLSNEHSDSKNSNKTITFILADGSLKKVNVTGCFNAQSIKRKVLRKLGIKLQENSYDTYVQSNDDGSVSLLFDVELVTICYSPERLEKHRILLCEKGQYPTDTAIEASNKIKAKYERFNKTKNMNQYHMPEGNLPTMRQFFGQRPPSELISSNLAEYFPEAHQKELEQSVRNSVRYSVRLSRRFNLPTGLGFASNISVNSITGSNNKRYSMFSNTTVKNPASISSSEYNLAAQRRLPGKTIGDVMMNHVNSIDEAVNQIPDNQSIFSKPSINSDKSNFSGTPAAAVAANANGQSPYAELKSVGSNNSHNNKPNHRISIAASFLDQSNDNNRYSRIELLNVDSDEDDSDEDFSDDLIGEYGQFETNPLLDQDGPKNWLKGARIGAGSFGTVYLGMSPWTGELMAVKQVALNNTNSELKKAMVEALQHEMLLLKNLNHENIVRYLGSSISEEFLNIFLEYVPGGSVQSMLSSYGPFEEPLIRNFIRQVLIGLSYLHGEDLIHRDIKGANILIDIKGTVKISDFGISKKISSKPEEEETGPDKKVSRRASLQGSVYWMAPEVVKQTAYTKKADIWSVGCLIVEMFTGKHPFPNFSQMQAIFRIGTHLSPDIPEWCTEEAKDFLRKTFELEYEDRPDAVDLLSEPFMNPLIMSKQ